MRLLIGLVALALAARTLHVEGLVVRVDRERSEIFVSHRAIPGSMPAMVMPVAVERPADLEGVQPGSRITFQLHDGRARHIKVLDARNEGVKEFRFPVPEEMLKPGESVPDFSLIDQRGESVKLSDFRGKVIMINFIYTRCPMAEVCPRLTASFSSLQRRFAGTDVRFLSITLDPTFDTPEILSAYAKRSAARYDQWRFLTGETEAVARRFGLVHWAEEGVILHTSATAVIDRNGRLAAIVEGSSFRLEQLSDLVRQIL